MSRTLLLRPGHSQEALRGAVARAFDVDASRVRLEGKWAPDDVARLYYNERPRFAASAMLFFDETLYRGLRSYDIARVVSETLVDDVLCRADGLRGYDTWDLRQWVLVRPDGRAYYAELVHRPSYQDVSLDEEPISLTEITDTSAWSGRAPWVGFPCPTDIVKTAQAIGQRVRRRRLARRYTIKQAIEGLQITPKTWSLFEEGALTNVSLNVLVDISAALDCELRDLVSD